MYKKHRRPWADGIAALLPNPLTRVELPPSVPPKNQQTQQPPPHNHNKSDNNQNLKRN